MGDLQNVPKLSSSLIYDLKMLSRLMQQCHNIDWLRSGHKTERKTVIFSFLIF